MSVPTPWGRVGLSRRVRGRVAGIAWVVALLAAGAARSWGASASEVFDAAARLYEQGHAEEAAQAYRHLRTNGVVTAAVLFNEGNAWLKAGKVGSAIACFRMARRHAPRDGDIEQNLALARSKVPAPAQRGSGGVRAWLERLTPNEWALAGTVSAWLWAGLQILRSLVPAVRARTAGGVWILGLLTVATLGLGGLAWRSAQGLEAVVRVPSAAARFGPLREAEAGFQLPDGAELRILDQKERWYRIRDAAGREGWVAGQDLEVI